MAKITVSRGSIVLIRYPLTDLSGIKVRPAVILTPDILIKRINDILCLFISSQLPAEKLPTDFILNLKDTSFTLTGSKYQSVFRTHKLALLHKSLCIKVLGKADNVLMSEKTRD